MSFKDLCEVLFLSYEENMISDEEFLLLYDLYSFEEPRIWTFGFNLRTRVLKSVTANQERFDMRSGCHAAKILAVGVRGTKNVRCLSSLLTRDKPLERLCGRLSVSEQPIWRGVSNSITWSLKVAEHSFAGAQR